MNTASFSQRLMAYNLDITAFMFLVFPISFFIESNTVMYFMAFSIICFYHAILESSAWQATLGKKYSNMKVVDLQNNQLSFFRAFLRILCKFISLGLLFAGFIMIYFRADRRGLHDLICGTKVIYEGK